jgi:immune inhibitor A
VRKTTAGLISLVLAAGAGASIGAGLPVASGAPSAAPEAASTLRGDARSDDLPNPLEDKRRALREEALTRLLHGKGRVEQRGASTVMKVGEARTAPASSKSGRRQAGATAEDQYVELSREKTDRIFVVLAEFSDTRHPDYPDKDTDPQTPGPQVFDGPAHNAIPAPDRSEDNSTVWQPDYDRAHYQQMYFGDGPDSVKSYYEQQSSGRYSVDGEVTDWVRVPYNEARYGRSGDPVAAGEPGDDPAVCGGSVCSNTWNLVEDAVNRWVADQQAAGRTDEQISSELATFDQWDRYDADADGDFNEPDGYIDHFQIVHAGGDEADGDPHQGEDAIWSHRWYVQTTPIGSGGPDGAPFGGTEIGDTGMWVGDYTIQPENGGVSVFAHEYGHDLGLPDLYDTSGGGENGVNYWSIMAQSRVDEKDSEDLGSRAADFGAWEKLQLGWLDYETVAAGERSRIELGPHEYNTAKPQAAVVVLPNKRVTTDLVPPYAGSASWWSGMGDDLANSLSRQVAVPAGTTTLSMQANWDIEDCGPDPCDYAYVQVDDGSGWTAIPGSITNADEGNGIDGTSNGWQPASFDLSAYAGQTVGLRLRYLTDGAVGGKGFFADDVTVTNGTDTLFTSGAENGDEGWTLDGYSAVGDSISGDYDNFYIASHRDYVSHDRYLQTGPYNFGWANTKPNWVERFPYQDGLLVSYWDTSVADNNTSEHEGSGLILPIDANPRPIMNLNGAYWRPRVAGYDATFSQERSDSFTLHTNGQESYIRGQRAQPTFNDGQQYWYRQQPTAGVKVPDNGVNISVLDTDGTSMTVRVAPRR